MAHAGLADSGSALHPTLDERRSHPVAVSPRRVLTQSNAVQCWTTLSRRGGALGSTGREPAHQAVNSYGLVCALRGVGATGVYHTVRSRRPSSPSMVVEAGALTVPP